MEQFFDRDVNPIEDYNTLHGMGFGKQLNQHLILHSKVVMGKMLLYL